MAVRSHWVVTVLGPDRPGLVEALSEWVVDAGGDWLDSHLVQVGDQFAGVMEVMIPADAVAAFTGGVAQVEARTGLALQVGESGTEPSPGQPVMLTCMGQDRPGIVRALTDGLLEFQANIESLDTHYTDAPMSGEQLFQARFRVHLPEGFDEAGLQSRLESIGHDLMLDVQFDPE